MNQVFTEISIQTNGQGFTDITNIINDWIKKNNLKLGILIISIKHTSCSLTINENADPRVLEDLKAYFNALVPEVGFKSLGSGQGINYLHNEEGLDDMPAHIKTALTSTSLSLSINESKLSLGTWQAIYLWEHRFAKFSRKISLHAIGDFFIES